MVIKSKYLTKRETHNPKTTQIQSIYSSSKKRKGSINIIKTSLKSMKNRLRLSNCHKITKKQQIS